MKIECKLQIFSLILVSLSLSLSLLLSTVRVSEPAEEEPRHSYWRWQWWQIVSLYHNLYTAIFVSVSFSCPTVVKCNLVRSQFQNLETDAHQAPETLARPCPSGHFSPLPLPLLVLDQIWAVGPKRLLAPISRASKATCCRQFK